MPLRAPSPVEWVVLGFVGIGLYATYRLVTNKHPSQTALGGGTSPNVPGGPAALNVPNRIVVDAKGARHIGLGHGTAVRGRIESADPNATAAKLRALGFSNVQLYTLADVQANPDLISFPDALLAPTNASRWVSAIWTGTPDNVTLPPEVVLLWWTPNDAPARAPARAPALRFAFS